MTNEEAERILNPKTSADALLRIEYFRGFNGKQARIEAVNEACRVACKALNNVKWIPIETEPSNNHSFAAKIVSELPEEDQEILVSDGEDVWEDTFVYDGEGHFRLTTGRNLADITAWMPKPENPEPYNYQK